MTIFRKIKSWLDYYVLGVKEVSDEEARQYVSQIIKQQYDESESETDTGQIVFIVDETGDLFIQINWTDTNPAIAQALGLVLYYISAGKLGQQCEYVLNETLKQDPSSRAFVQSIANSWRYCVDQENVVIKPSEVFSLGKQRLNGGRHQ